MFQWKPGISILSKYRPILTVSLIFDVYKYLSVDWVGYCCSGEDLVSKPPQQSEEDDEAAPAWGWR